MTQRAHLRGIAPFLPLCCCIATSLLTLLVIRAIWAFGPQASHGGRGTTDWHSLAIAFIIPCVLTAVLSIAPRARFLSLPRIVRLSFVILLLFAVANVTWRFVHLAAYGDADLFSQTIQSDQVFPRWFLGSAILTRSYQSLWLTVGPHLPPTLSTVDGFVRLTGAVLMACSSLIFLRAHGDRLSVLVPLLTPIWLLFCTGYNEYYPFIAWGYLGVLLLVLDGLAKRSPTFVAGISSFLCLSYATFVPLGFLVIACYALTASVKKAFIACLITALLCIGALILLWPESLISFFAQYPLTLNLGDQGTLSPAYVGKSAGPMTPFFAVSYAFSVQHMSHLSFMFLFGSGIVPPVLLAVAFLACLKKGLLAQVAAARSVFFGVGSFLAFHLAYFFFMIPKLGFVQDIDLFFTVYLTVGFVGGFLADRFLETIAPHAQALWVNCIVATSLGSSGVILMHLLRIGVLPP